MAIINMKADGEDRKERDAAPNWDHPAPQGGPGDPASCGILFFGDDCATRGGKGGDGAPGVAGADGEHGGHAGTLQIEANSFDVIIALSAKGGRGGRGGRGGNGQEGGRGGKGGDGEDCEFGGKGGDGGHGGNAGPGGHGGNGGNGGVIVLMARDFTGRPSDLLMDVSGGAPGGEGEAGMPGEGGKPGDDGPESGGAKSSDCDRRAALPGPPGGSVPQDPNRSGASGQSGVATRRLIS